MLLLNITASLLTAFVKFCKYFLVSFSSQGLSLCFSFLTYELQLAN